MTEPKFHVWEHDDHTVCESETMHQHGATFTCDAHDREVHVR